MDIAVLFVERKAAWLSVAMVSKYALRCWKGEWSRWNFRVGQLSMTKSVLVVALCSASEVQKRPTGPATSWACLVHLDLLPYVGGGQDEGAEAKANALGRT